ncbi:DNA/RNA polymerases superfamily protein [Theobroma cacao]|uniref:DNA/RNA polymerases superfamily protein n=1 Tax=Theobroma cacao TaxID=3641 RepID=A0A061FRM1_THECC|nr:DNA/RNA polymerases superfamily protein [Theobroma cacao]
MENPEGDHNPLEIHNLEDDDEFENQNPFHEDGPANQAARVGLEGQLLHALDLNGGGIRIDVIDFHEKFHAEEYLNWEASLENYFEWKPMAKNRKVLFVKLKLKGTALQWWKRVEEQRARQAESNEQITSLYLAGLNHSIRNEMGVVRLYNIEDARQYALSAERKVSRYSARKALYGTDWQNDFEARQGYQTSQQNYQGATTTNKTNGGATNVEKNDKGKSIMPYGRQNSSSSSTNKGGSNSHIRCFTCGEKEHISFACPQRRRAKYYFKRSNSKLKLPTSKHPHPYKIRWIKKGHKVPVNTQCLVKFTMGDNLDDEALCDVVPMDVGHILVGRLWLYDHDMDHKTKPNTYSFYKDNKWYTLYPLKEEIKKSATSSPTNSKISKITGYLSVENFGAEGGNEKE